MTFDRLAVPSKRDFSRSPAGMVALIIDHAELSGSYAVDFLLRMDDVSAVVSPFYRGRMVLRRMPYFEADLA